MTGSTDSKWSTEVCPVEVQDCEWLEKLARLKAENEELKQLVTTDPLTGLYNYRYFEEILCSEMQRTQRTGRPTSLVMIDLDHFKAVNDQWGHEAGNKALQTAARIFREEVRLFDIICRYGGEEFALILPQTGLRIAVTVAERIRACLQRNPVRVDDLEFNVTASFGVAQYQQGSDLSPQALVEMADRYLYEAKQQGRDRVCHPDFTSIHPPTEVSADEKSELFKQQRKDE